MQLDRSSHQGPPLGQGAHDLEIAGSLLGWSQSDTLPTWLNSALGSFSSEPSPVSGLRRYRMTTSLKVGSWMVNVLNRFLITDAASGMMACRVTLWTTCNKAKRMC